MPFNADDMALGMKWAGKAKNRWTPSLDVKCVAKDAAKDADFVAPGLPGSE